MDRMSRRRGNKDDQNEEEEEDAGERNTSLPKERETRAVGEDEMVFLITCQIFPHHKYPPLFPPAH